MHFQPACVLSFIVFLMILPGIMGEIALLKRLKSSRITRYMDSIKTKVRTLLLRPVKHSRSASASLYFSANVVSGLLVHRHRIRGRGVARRHAQTLWPVAGKTCCQVHCAAVRRPRFSTPAGIFHCICPQCTHSRTLGCHPS